MGTILCREQHKVDSKVDHNFEFDFLIYNHDDAELQVFGLFYKILGYT